MFQIQELINISRLKACSDWNDNSKDNKNNKDEKNRSRAVKWTCSDQNNNDNESKKLLSLESLVE